MEFLTLPVSKIKPDPDQPRQTLDQDKIKDMAQSIRTEGIINAIEVDRQYRIITGEMRWRAAKVAGLTEVPCKILDISPEERFRRQVIENIHNLTMNPWDTAKALEKLLHDERQAFIKTHKGGLPDQGIRKLAREIGMNINTLRDYLDLLKVSAPLQKAVRKGDVPFSMTRAISRAPEFYRKELEKKILQGKFKTRDEAIEVAIALQRTPGKGEQILNAKNLQEVYKLSPRQLDKAELALEPSQEFRRIKNELFNWLDKYPPQAVLGSRKLTVLLGVTVLITKLARWAKTAEQKQLN